MPTRCQSAIASSSGPSFSSGSPAWTLTQRRSQSSFNRSRTNSVANSIAPSLKYCPNEKLPSISKKVRWYVSSPTSSMSTVRKHFCESVVVGAGGASRPRKYGICGCIPAVIRSVERSSERGISDADGRRRWPFDSKNERYPSRSSGVVGTPGFYGGPWQATRPRRRILIAMALPVLERVDDRRYRRRRQIRRRRATALLLLAASIAVPLWVTRTHHVAAPAGQQPVAATAQPAPSVVQKARPAPLLTGPPALGQHRFTPALTAHSAILVDADTGRVLYALRAHTRRPIASTTKIMTALVALKRLSP